MVNPLQRWAGDPSRVMRTPAAVEIEITGRCNLRCAYCYFHDDAVVMDRHEIPTNQWLEFFDELGRCATFKVVLAGGEPSMRTDLRTLVHRRHGAMRRRSNLR